MSLCLKQTSSFSQDLSIQAILDLCAKEGPGVSLDRIKINVNRHRNEEGKVTGTSFSLQIPDDIAQAEMGGLESFEGGFETFPS